MRSRDRKYGCSCNSIQHFQRTPSNGGNNVCSFCRGITGQPDRREHRFQLLDSQGSQELQELLVRQVQREPQELA